MTTISEMGVDWGRGYNSLEANLAATCKHVEVGLKYFPLKIGEGDDQLHLLMSLVPCFLSSPMGAFETNRSATKEISYTLLRNQWKSVEIHRNQSRNH